MDDFEMEMVERRRAALLEGISRPVQEDDPGWVDAAERLMARGVSTYQQLGDLLEIPFKQARGLLEAVRERWRNSESSALAAERREELYQRVKAVGDVAFDTALGLPGGSNQRAKYLAVALNANDRAAELAGVKKTHTEVKVEVELRTRPAKEILQQFGGIDLKQLGKLASRGAVAELEQQEEVVDAEFEASEGVVAELKHE